MILFIKSFVVGICALLPGVSGSVIAVTFGIYDKFFEIISDTRKIKDNKTYLLIVFMGILCGIFLTSHLILYIFRFETIIFYTLIGIILSEVPFLIKKIHDETERGIMLAPLIIAFMFSLCLDLINQANLISSYSIFKYFFGGILFSFGKVFPGISSSFFLLCLGIYDEIIILITKPILLINNFYFYIPFIIGTIFGLIVFIRLLSYLMNRHFRFIYSVIIGFILSSVIILFPQFNLNVSSILGIILMIISFIFSIYLKKKNEK